MGAVEILSDKDTIGNTIILFLIVVVSCIFRLEIAYNLATFFQTSCAIVRYGEDYGIKMLIVWIKARNFYSFKKDIFKKISARGIT